jgi:hypothetical protein
MTRRAVLSNELEHLSQTGVRRCAPNSRISNVISACCLIISYTSTSQMLLSPSLNGVAAVAIGIGLFGQALLSTWCRIITWSSNPLNTTLALVHSGPIHRSGRCMTSALDPEIQDAAVVPSRRQSILQAVNSSIK